MMGVNTVAVLLNDHCAEFEASGQLGKRISYSMQNWNSVTLEGWFGAGRVISRDHADGYQVTVVHGNTGCTISEATDLPYITLSQLADCLNRHGWRTAPPSRKRKAATDELRIIGDIGPLLREGEHG